MRFFLFSFLFFAGFKGFSKDKDFLILEIEVLGLERTEKRVALRELTFKASERISEKVLQESLANIRNTRLFSRVDYSLEDKGMGKKLILRLKEKWTTIPIFKVARGGGVQKLTLGVYDVNILGKGFETGAQLERLSKTTSGVIWFKNPRIFDSATGVDFQLWNINILRTKYYSEPIKPVIYKGFLHIRKKALLRIHHKFTDMFEASLLLEHHTDDFSYSYAEEKIKKITEENGGLPEGSQIYYLGLSASYGKINYNGHLVSGYKALASYRRARSLERHKNKAFGRYDFELLYGKTLLGSATFAQRILAGSTGSDYLQYWYYLGGLDGIRGFQVDRFSGRQYWLSNTELRSSPYRGDRYLLQGVLFYDAAAVGHEKRDLTKTKATSAGFGVRFMMPDIYRLVVRLDFAKTLKRYDNRTVNFGLQQFF